RIVQPIGVVLNAGRHTCRAYPVPTAQTATQKAIYTFGKSICSGQFGSTRQFSVDRKSVRKVCLINVYCNPLLWREVGAQRQAAGQLKLVCQSRRGGFGRFGRQRAKRRKPR